MGALAESFGLRQGIKYRKAIKEALETVLRLDPAFQQGSADRALGRWYYKVPGIFGGSHKHSEEHLRESLKYNAQSTASHFFLAELLLDDGRKAEARAELQKVIEHSAGRRCRRHYTRKKSPCRAYQLSLAWHGSSRCRQARTSAPALA